MQNWFGVSRWTYNWAIQQLKEPGAKTNAFEYQKKMLTAMPEWGKATPSAIKQGAVADACKAVKNAKVKSLKTKIISEVKFRSKHQDQTLFIRNDMIRGGTVYPSKMGKLKMAESLPDKCKDSRLVLESGRYYLCVPYKIEVPAENQGKGIVGLDPGVRTFMSFYSPTSAGKLAEYDFGRIARLCKHLDNLLSKADKARKDARLNAKKRRNVRKAVSKLRWKVKDLVSEMHWKVATFLVKNFSIIFLPELETAKLACKTKRKLGKNSARAMLTWSHYKFQQRLKHMANKYGVLVMPVCEAYTSKTVNWTGELNHTLGGAKFVKSADGRKMDRDLNGALGVFLKGIVGYNLHNRVVLHASTGTPY